MLFFAQIHHNFCDFPPLTDADALPCFVLVKGVGLSFKTKKKTGKARDKEVFSIKHAQSRCYGL